MRPFRWFISSRSTVVSLGRGGALAGYGAGLYWAPGVDGAGPGFDFLEMAPVYPVVGRIMGLPCGMVMAAAAATAA